MGNQKPKICPVCGKSNGQNSNFCEFCGAKLSEVCVYCWVKKEKFECGEDVCPGFKLLFNR